MEKQKDTVMNRFMLIPILAVVAAFAGCDPNGPGPEPGPQEQVLVIGNYSDQSDLSQGSYPCYWRDGECFDLDLNVPAEATGTYVRSAIFHEGSIYITGNYYISPLSVGCYWIDGVRFDLNVPEGASGIASAITVVDGKIYTAGSYSIRRDGSSRSTPCYWVDGVRTDLDFPDEDVNVDNNAVSIAVSGGRVYVAGFYGTPYITVPGYRRARRSPCYWIDGVRIDLNVPENSTEADVSSIAVMDGRVHVSGSYGTSELSSMLRESTACVWMDGVRTDLEIPAGTRDGDVSASVVSDNTIYVAGSYRNAQGGLNSCYWVNGVRTDLEAPESGYTNVITVFNGKIFVAGQHSSGTPCWWVDGVRTDLESMEWPLSIGVVAIVVYNNG